MKSELPRSLRLAPSKAVPLSAAPVSQGDYSRLDEVFRIFWMHSAAVPFLGTSFVFSFLNSHLSAKDTSYTENLSVIITNPTDQNALVTVGNNTEAVEKAKEAML